MRILRIIIFKKIIMIKKNIIDGLNLNYENEKQIFEQQKKNDESNLYNFYTQAVEDLENGKEIELDDMP